MFFLYSSVRVMIWAMLSEIKAMYVYVLYVCIWLYWSWQDNGVNFTANGDGVFRRNESRMPTMRISRLSSSSSSR